MTVLNEVAVWKICIMHSFCHIKNLLRDCFGLPNYLCFKVLFFLLTLLRCFLTATTENDTSFSLVFSFLLCRNDLFKEHTLSFSSSIPRHT